MAGDKADFDHLFAFVADRRVMTTALPCPFCGTPHASVEGPERVEPKYSYGQDMASDMCLRFWVECAQCGAQGPPTYPLFESRSDSEREVRVIQGSAAYQSWNVRHPHPQPAVDVRLQGRPGCPFCGSGLVVVDPDVVACMNCGCRGPARLGAIHADKKGRIKLWAARHEIQEPIRALGDAHFRRMRERHD